MPTTPIPSDPIEACFLALERAVERDPALSRELAASRDVFLPGLEGEAEGSREATLARRRMLEWFLLEKVRTAPEEARVTALLDRCAASTAGDAATVSRALAGSHASVFEVTGVDPDGGVRLWDLAGLFEFLAIEPAGARVLEQGDLIAGRVFPIDASTCRISRAAVVWRNQRLLEAIRADLERAREAGPPGRKGTLRLRQADLEAMFHLHGHGTEAKGPREAGPSAPSAIDRARRLLAGAGVEPSEVDSIFRILAAERPGERDLVPGLLPGAHDALAAVLDELAFDTSIDLIAARKTLTAAWEELYAARMAPDEPEPLQEPGQQPADVASAVAAFDRRRSAGASLDETFRDLERDLGLADEPSEDEEDTPAPDFPGVVGAIVEEFLWEQQIEHGAETAERYAILKSLGRFAAGIGLLENLSARELSAYACHWVLAEREVADAESAARLVDALERFCAWAQETQEVPLQKTFGPVAASLRDSLPRLAEANRKCVRDGESEGLEWIDVVGVEGARSLRVRGTATENLVLAADPAGRLGAPAR
jgi:hypothetical protein